MLRRHYGAKTKEWEFDRSNTVGASEVGQCLRRIWFAKHGTPHDETYKDRHGARLRGNLIEDHYVVPGLRAELEKASWRFLWAGAEQRTIVDGYLSATPDGLAVNKETGEAVVIEVKSIDPRVDLQTEKAEHAFQAQVQMGLLHHATEHRPERAIILYIDASFLDDITEFPVVRDPAVYKAAEARARSVMLAEAGIELSPEGKIAGGKECAYCPWASHCAHVSTAAIPSENATLGDNAASELRRLRDKERRLAAEAEHCAAAHNAAKEEIKSFLRGHSLRWYNGDGWSVSWQPVKGRETIDIKAAQESGIDLSPFSKTGNPSDRLVVK